MAKIICYKCGKEVASEEFFCPYCNNPIEIDEEEDVQDQVQEATDQSGFGIASFVLAIIAIILVFFGTIIPFFETIGTMIAIIAFIFGCVGMFSKNRKHGMAIAGNIISFIALLPLLFVIFAVVVLDGFGR